MSEKLEKLEHEKYVAEKKLTAAIHREKQLQSELKRLTRSERTHRLCTRAGMLETFLKEPTLLTDDDVMEAEILARSKGATIHRPKAVRCVLPEAPCREQKISVVLLQSSRGSYASPALASPTTPL